MKKHQDIIVVLIGITVGLAALWLIFNDQKTAFDELGLGIGTISVHDTLDGRHIHCSDLPRAEACIADTNKKERRRIALLGWSQLHGINQYKKGQRNAPWLLAKAFDKQNIDFLTFSQGRANPQEHYVLSEWLQTQTKLDALVIGAWIQGMREENIRASIALAAEHTDTRQRLESTALGVKALAVMSPRDNVSTQIAENFQVRVEQSILDALKTHFTLWEIREEAEGQIRIFFRNFKFHFVKLRNRLLGLKKENWIWPIPQARYDNNIVFLEGIVEQARQNQLEVLIYIPPKPTDGHFHFDPKTYHRFKQDVKTFADKHGAHFANLESCVKGQVWGMTKDGDGELARDMTHFTAEGHTQLAACLEKKVSQHFEVAK